MSENACIGILGGMGAAAGVRVFSELVRQCQRRGAKCDADFPTIFVHSMNSKGMDNTGVINERVFKDDLEDGISVLDHLQCDAILMACNTAYIYRDHLQPLCDAEIIDVPRLAVKACEGKSFGVVCSRSTRKANLYDGGTYCDEEKQPFIDDLIQAAIEGTRKPKDEDALVRLLYDMHSGGHKVIVGCTELPLLLDGRWPDFAVDPMELGIEEALA